MRYCHPCEREYRAERREATLAKHRKHNKKRAAQIAEDREDDIQWWMHLSGTALAKIKEMYRKQGKALPRTYFTAMRRIERARRRAEVAHLEGLKDKSPGLSKAALRFRNAGLKGSRVKDTREYMDGNPHF